LRVIGITAGLPAAPGEVTVTVPLNVPGVVKFTALIEILMFDGTVPLRVDESHPDGPLVVAGAVVKLSPALPVMLTD
jgi:hypothetical protein